MVTALRRLPKRSKSVSEPHLSLIDRPRPPEGRFKIMFNYRYLSIWGERPFRKCNRYPLFSGGIKAMNLSIVRHKGNAVAQHVVIATQPCDTV